MELLSETIENYFSNLNPIARKIYFDINETKSSYEHIWSELSAKEQRDIINETLIKPEIALRYFDSFTSLSGSLSNSTVIDDSGDNEPNSPKPKLNVQQNESTTSNIYSYDNKNLLTYSAQKTGFKIIHDEVAGIFRDEHSAPFSFRTKSQINLHIFSNTSQTDHTATSKNLSETFNEYPNAQNVALKLQKPTTKCVNDIKLGTSNFSSNLITSLPIDKSATRKYERFYDEQKNETIGTSNNLKDSSDTKGNFFSKFICKNNLIFNTGANMMVKSAQNIDYNDEGATLMNNASCSSGLASSLSVPSEEEEEKPVYEDSKLLLETDDLRKGFDFLNNW